LIVEDVQYEQDDAQLQVTIRNLGDGALEDRVVTVDLLRPDGSPISPPLRPTVALLEHAQSTTITWPSIDSRVRTSMLDGYTVRLNAEGRLLEEDLTNNDYTVPAGQRIWVQFLYSRVWPFFEDWRGSRFGFPVHHFVIGLTASVVGGDSSQRFGDWSQDFDFVEYTDDRHRIAGCRVLVRSAVMNGW
jgi:hypothetical protein